MRCVSYVRVASCLRDIQREGDSLRRQRDAISKYVKMRGWCLHGEYVDSEEDAKDEAVLYSVQQDGINRRFDMVVLYSLSGFGGNISHAEDVLRKIFYPAGIHFAVIEDNVCSLSMTNARVAEYFRQKRNAYFGGVLGSLLRERACQGYLSVHDEKYGYLLSEDCKRLVVDTAAAFVIQAVFHWVADEELSYHEVANRLNDLGWEPPLAHLARVGKMRRSRGSGRWSAGSVKHVINNPIYVGVFKKIIDGRCREIKLEPIVEKDLFERAIRVNSRENSTSYNKDDSFCERRQKRVAEAREGECRRARFVKRWVLSAEGKEARAREMAVFSVRGKILFDEIAAAEEEHLRYYGFYLRGELSHAEYLKMRESLLSLILQKEAAFCDLMEQVKIHKKAFSLRNPWIVAYGDSELQGSLSNKDSLPGTKGRTVSSVKMVDSIVPPKYAVWRDRLPVGGKEGV